MVSAETVCCEPGSSCYPCTEWGLGDVGCVWVGPYQNQYCCDCITGVIECQPGDTRCHPYDDYILQDCYDGTWHGYMTCLSGCFAGDCLAVECNTGERRCDPDDPYEVQKCENGVWVDFVSCAFGECYGAGQCPSTQCTEGDVRCDPDDPYGVEKCTGGFWQDWKACSFGECYGSGQCPEENLEPEIVQTQTPYVSVDNETNTITVTVYIKNNGGDMTDNWLVELQPRTSHLLSFIGQQDVCDFRYPWNVHKEFSLDEQESVMITLSSVVQNGVYDLYLVSTDKCCVDRNGNQVQPPCEPAGPYNWGRFVQTVVVGDSDNGNGNGGNGDENWAEWLVSFFNDYFLHILVLIFVVVGIGVLINKNKGGSGAK